MDSIRITPLALTVALAVITGILAVIIWALLAGHFAAMGTPDGAANKSSTLVLGLTNVSSMAAYMPLPPNGWSPINSTGAVVTDQPGQFSFARNDYSLNGSDDTAAVIIYDSGGHDIIWNSIFKTGFIYSDDSGYARVYTYKGIPAWETAKYADDGNVYSMYLKLDDRYGIAILLKNASDASPMKDFADRINVYAITDLGK